MFEYQINVAKEGYFLFRTDWESDRQRANEAYSAIKVGFNDSIYEITVVRRSPVMERVSF
jgi:hypothetical protein